MAGFILLASNQSPVNVPLQASSGDKEASVLVVKHHRLRVELPDGKIRGNQRRHCRIICISARKIVTEDVAHVVGAVQDGVHDVAVGIARFDTLTQGHIEEPKVSQVCHRWAVGVPGRCRPFVLGNDSATHSRRSATDVALRSTSSLGGESSISRDEIS